jgi:hypothetical protein
MERKMEEWGMGNVGEYYSMKTYISSNGLRTELLMDVKTSLIKIKFLCQHTTTIYKTWSFHSSFNKWELHILNTNRQDSWKKK